MRLIESMNVVRMNVKQKHERGGIKSMNQHKLIYLAAPYTHPSQTVRETRYQQLMEYFIQQLQTGSYIFSPILHSVNTHNRAYIDGNKVEYKTWISLDLNILSRCDELHILQLDGWKESLEVEQEYQKAKELDILIKWVFPLSCEGFGAYNQT